MTFYDQDTDPDLSCPRCAWTGWDVASFSHRHCSRCGHWYGQQGQGYATSVTQQQRDQQDQGQRQDQGEDPIEMTRQVSGTATEPGQEPGQPTQPGQPGQPETDQQRRQREEREERERQQR